MKARNVTFYIHGGNYVYYSFYATNGRIRATTGITVKDGQSLDDVDKPGKHRMSRIEMLIDEYVGQCRIANKPVEVAPVKEIVLAEIGKKAKGGLTVIELIKKYRDAAVAGKVINSQKLKHTAGTTRLYDTVIKHIENDPIKSVLVEDLTEQTIKSYYSRLMYMYKYGNDKLGYISKNTASTYNNLFISILSASLELGWHNNRVTKNAELSMAGESIDYAVYYSIDELKRLHAHQFANDKYNALKDVFIFGCFVGFRHSDYYATDYTKSISGGQIVTKLKKKQNKVSVPIHPIAMDVLKKHNFLIPKIKMWEFDIHIKHVVKEAGFNDLVLFSRTEGGQLRREYKEKWELTSSHTMRRSFATNALKMGMPEWAVMLIGGWKSESAFKKYKRMSETDAYDAAFSSDFYKTTM